VISIWANAETLNAIHAAARILFVNFIRVILL
jgi:hypothetical protein